MDGENQGINGWTGKALDLLKDRVDAIRSDLNLIMGKPHESERPPKESDLRIAGIGLTTWIALLATVVVPLVGTAALVILHTP